MFVRKRNLVKGLRRLSQRQTRLEKEFELLLAEVKERHLSMSRQLFRHNWNVELMFVPKGAEKMAGITNEEEF